MKFELFTILLMTAATVSSQDELLVETNTGPVRGIKVTTPPGKTIDTFYGIPFAKPPVGDLRFRRPQQVEPWTEVFNATTKPNGCFQLPDTMFGNFSGSTKYNLNTPMKEDCLYLNIWVPNPRPTKSAVLLWIYGGGFSTGSSALELYDGSILAGEENIIVASMNYRVTALGFLYLGTELAPGNMGLLDQLMAMEWIHNNIANFGGDPDRITIFGESAGSCSVSYHLISPLSWDYFSNAIMESGASTASWGWSSPEKVKEYSLRLADKLGCTEKEGDLNAVANCLKQKDPNVIISTSLDITGFGDIGLAPVTDEYLITKSPSQHLSEGDFKKCPILAGSTHDEGTYFMIYTFNKYFPKKEDIHISKDTFLEILSQLHSEFVAIPGETISFEYTDWSDDPNESNYLNSVNKIITDKYIHCPINQFAEVYAKEEHVYMYHFSHRSKPCPWPSWMGVQHGDEMPFVFGEPFKPGMGYTDEEREISQSIMKYWANFARSGNPNEPSEVAVEWPEFKSKKEYLDIGNTTVAGTGLRTKKCVFWDNYLPKIMNATAKKQ